MGATLLLGRSGAELMTSWYDPSLTRTLDSFRSDPTGQLVVGPWGTDRTATHAGDVDFGPDARSNDAGDSARVRIFVMGGGSGRRNADGRLLHGGHWRAERGWPLDRATPTPFYLLRSGELSRTRAPEDFTWDEYAYDPRDPVPTVGATPGAYDQRHAGRPLAQRRDVLVFQTPPLAEPVEVTGPIVANLWIASDCPDTDFTIKLIDVYPPSADYPQGFAMNLTDGLLSVRHRVSRERPALMVPGSVHPIAVHAPATSNLFARGHRIRLDVSSSNAPKFGPNPNTGSATATTRVATNRLYLDRARPSHLLLPIVRA